MITVVNAVVIAVVVQTLIMCHSRLFMRVIVGVTTLPSQKRIQSLRMRLHNHSNFDRLYKMRCWRKAPRSWLLVVD